MWIIRALIAHTLYEVSRALECVFAQLDEWQARTLARRAVRARRREALR